MSVLIKPAALLMPCSPFSYCFSSLLPLPPQNIFGNFCQHLKYKQKSISRSSPLSCFEATPVRLLLHCSVKIALNIVTSGKHVANSMSLLSLHLAWSESSIWCNWPPWDTSFTWLPRTHGVLGCTLFTGYAFQCPSLVPPLLPDPLNLKCPKSSLLSTSPFLMHSYSWWSHPVSWLSTLSIHWIRYLCLWLGPLPGTSDPHIHLSTQNLCLDVN